MQKSNGYMIRKILRVYALCILSCVLCTCVQQLQEQPAAGGNSPRTVTVYFGGDGRAAMPVLTDNIRYTITANAGGTEPKVFEVPEGSTYCDLDLSGTKGDVWTITVNAYLDEDRTTPILSGSTTFTLPQQAVTVTLLNISVGIGDVDLGITVSATGVNKLYISGTNTGLDGDYQATNSTITIKQTGIAAGTYDALFSFYSGDVLIARCREAINVCANLTTSRWVTAGNSILINSTGEFNLTSEAVERLTSTTLYVKGSTGGTLGANGSDSNPGTWLEPFATLQAAVNRVIALNNVRNVAYTIFIDGTVTGTSGADMAEIKPGKTLNLTICGRTGTTTDSLTATASRILYIGANASVTVTNLMLTGGNGASTLESGNGGGVYVDGGTFTLGSGGVITGCSAKNGGGVYMSGGTFTMSTETDTSATPHIFGNTAKQDAGGVYVSGGTFTMDNSAKVSGNSATTGGGVYVRAGSFEMNGGTVGGSKSYDETATDKTDMGNTATTSGGGVCMTGTGTFTMTRGTIRYNSADIDGGGVYVYDNDNGSGTFVMSDGEIINNSAKGSDIYGGGGVWNKGTFTMNGGTISGNTATTNGGGVWNKGAFTMNDGTISGNKATINGGGVYMVDGTFDMTGGIIGTEVTGLTVGTQITAAKAPTAGNCSNSAKAGGGIYIAGGTVTMTGDSAVASNYASALWAGGGVHVDGGVFNFGQDTDTTQPQIYANAADDRGGGVLVGADGRKDGGEMHLYGSIHHNYSGTRSGGVEVGAGTITMYSGASIRDNFSKGPYGGVHMSEASSGKFNMTGGTITNNASVTAPELYAQYQLFSMSGDAVVTTTDNSYTGIRLVVQVDSNEPATITVGKLTGGAQIVAAVSPDSYTEDTPILRFVSALPEADRIAACARFKIPNDAAGNMYSIVYDSEKGQGVLKKSAITVTLFGSYKLVTPETAAPNETISLSVTDSDDKPVGSAVTAATIALYQNGMQVSTLTSTRADGTMPSLQLPSWLPAGTYQLYITAEINGNTYSGYADIKITL